MSVVQLDGVAPAAIEVDPVAARLDNARPANDEPRTVAVEDVLRGPLVAQIARGPDFFYEVIAGGDVLLYPNPDSAAARNFYAHEVFSNHAEVRDGAIWVEDRNWEDVRDHWLPSEGLTVAPRADR